MLIRTAKQSYPVIMAGGYRQFVDKQVRARWMRSPNWATRGHIPAEICASTWRVACPYCKDALVAEPGEPFYCVNCCMQANGGYAMVVDWPPASVRQQIEAVLLLRPDPDTRNWLPKRNESLSDLVHENLTHGVTVPNWALTGGQTHVVG